MPLAALQSLQHHRFAVRDDSTLTLNIREFLMANHTPTAHHKPLMMDTWWLIGTDGCHLCRTALETIHMVSTAYPVPSVQVVELTDFSNEIISALATLIPVLVTADSLVCYPFATADIVALSKKRFG